MEKIRFVNFEDNADWDGATVVAASDITWSFVGGFHEAVLPRLAGRIPASLFGKAPGADCYLMHATMFAAADITATDYLAVKTREPSSRYRRLWTPSPGNTRSTIVRPDDVLEFRLVPTGRAFLELLLEPLANANELGPILLGNLSEEARENRNPTAQGEMTVNGNSPVPLFSGVLRVYSTAGAGIQLSLPDATALTLSDLLIVERSSAAGVVTLAPTLGQTINGAATFAIPTANTAVFVRGGLGKWTVVGGAVT